ncbi:unnamed protein product [Sphagnum balticum]
MVNLLQRVNSEAQIKKPTTTWQSASTRNNHDWVEDHDQTIETQEDTASSSDFDACTNSSEHGEEESSPERRVDYEDEFGKGELEKLVESEGPPEILQLILQEQADDFMNKEISEGDDYADWMQWVRDTEQSRRTERAPDAVAKFSLQRSGQMNVPSILTLRQVMQIKNDNSDHSDVKRLGLSNHEEMGTRWSEICQRIRIDSDLEEGEQQQL